MWARVHGAVNPDDRHRQLLPFGSGSWMSPLLRSGSMEQEPREKIRAGRLSGAVGVLGVGAGAVVWLSPGGLGQAGAVQVTGGASASAYRSVTGAVADAPSWLGPLLEVATEGTLVILAMLLAW